MGGEVLRAENGSATAPGIASIQPFTAAARLVSFRSAVTPGFLNMPVSRLRIFIGHYLQLFEAISRMPCIRRTFSHSCHSCHSCRREADKPIVRWSSWRSSDLIRHVGVPAETPRGNTELLAERRRIGARTPIAALRGGVQTPAPLCERGGRVPQPSLLPPGFNRHARLVREATLKCP